MIKNDIVKNILAYNKAGFENAFNSLVYIQNQAEGFIEKTLDENTYIPKEGKDLVKNWIKMGKDARDNAKRAVNSGQDQFEALIVPRS
jgi:hypothetical protein